MYNNYKIVNILLSHHNIYKRPNDFSECSNLTEIIIPTSVKAISEYSFYKCYSLKKIELPSSILSIGKSAFEECASIKSLIIPSSVKYIGEYCFFECISLEEINIPSSTTIIEQSTFRNCSSLVQVSIPSSLTEIGNYAFSGCISLFELTIPSNIKSIGCFAFNNCTSLEEFEIPPEVKIIQPYTFAYCSNLCDIKLPKSLVRIGDYAFKNCSFLNNIILPSSLKTIGESSFCGCTFLEKLLIPPSVEEIENRAFCNTALNPTIIPPTVKKVGHLIFDKILEVDNSKEVKNYNLRRFSFKLSYKMNEDEYINELKISCNVLKVKKKNTDQIYIQKVEPNYTMDYCLDKKRVFMGDLIESDIRHRINADHPTFLKFYGYTLQKYFDKRLKMIIEYAPNGTLESLLDKIQKSNCPEKYDNTCRQIILIGISRGMKYLADCGMTNSRLDPSNVYLDDNYHPLISSCGMERSSQYHPKIVKQISHQVRICTYDENDDSISAFSIILYEVVTNRIPSLEECQSNLRFDFAVNEKIKQLIEQCRLPDKNERPTFKEIFNKLAYDNDYYLDDVDMNEIRKYLDVITDK